MARKKKTTTEISAVATVPQPVVDEPKPVPVPKPKPQRSPIRIDIGALQNRISEGGTYKCPELADKCGMDVDHFRECMKESGIKPVVHDQYSGRDVIRWAFQAR